MGFAMNPNGSWQQVAIFEVEGGASIVDSLLTRLRAEFESSEWVVLPVPRCLPARVWFQARVDFGIGERRAIRVASCLIEEVGRAKLPGYRLVAGREWLDLAVAQMHAEVAPGVSPEFATTPERRRPGCNRNPAGVAHWLARRWVNRVSPSRTFLRNTG
ncbi:hypothetical protein [Dokdonella sp.]|uniref:hypothetical protein n=1 Tax=Dokdonella sp. TaxID=2291710 RepID=UPI00378361AF